MSSGRGKMLKRKLSPTHGLVEDFHDVPRHKDGHMRVAVEHRSKHNQDMHAFKGKAKLRSPTPPPKLRKVVQVQNTSSSEEDMAPIRKKHFQDVKVEQSSGDDSSDDEVNSEDSNDDSDAGHRRSKFGKRRGQREEKKPITLDPSGYPYGSMREVLSDDIKRYAKDLDPTTSWEGQPGSQRRQFFKQLYSNWKMKGQSSGVNEKWVSPIVTKILINTRWRLNSLIDGMKPKPPEVTDEQWNTLTTNRALPAARKVSEHMRAISLGKGSKAIQLKTIEKDAIVKLSIQHQRAPFDCEITEEVAREYRRQEEEKQLAAVGEGGHMNGVNSRVTSIEGSVARLEEKIESSHARLEGLLGELLSGPTLKSNIPCELLPDATLPVKAKDPATAIAESSGATLSRLGIPVVAIGLNVEEELRVTLPTLVKGNVVADDICVGDAADHTIEGTAEEDAYDINVEGVTGSVQTILNAVRGGQAEKDDDVYAIGVFSPTKKMPVKVTQISDPDLPHREDINVNRDSLSRGRRLTKTSQSPSASRPTIAAKAEKVATVKVVASAKPPQPLLKVVNGKRVDAVRRK